MSRVYDPDFRLHQLEITVKRVSAYCKPLDLGFELEARPHPRTIYVDDPTKPVTQPIAYKLFMSEVREGEPPNYSRLADALLPWGDDAVIDYLQRELNAMIIRRMYLEEQRKPRCTIRKKLEAWR